MISFYNFSYGVRVTSDQPGVKSIFFPKRTALITQRTPANPTTEEFLIRLIHSSASAPDWQPIFSLADVLEIKNEGVIVPIPGTADLLYELLASFFNNDFPPVNNSIVPITGVNYNAVSADNGKTFLFDLPGTPKTFTIPAGLPVGWKCDVVKMYAASTITVVGSGGMIISGLDLVLNGQFAKMQILVVGATSTLAFNIGG